MLPYSFPLLERDRELDALDDAIRSASGGAGGLVLIEGEAGIGKTELLREAAVRASAAGMRVVSAAGSELERGIPWGVARTLLEEALRGLDPPAREDLLIGVARPARVLLEEPAPGPPQPAAALLHAAYWVLLGLSERAPVLLAVDDGHAADDATLELIRYLARRVQDHPIAIVLARRRPTAPDDLGALAGVRLQPAPLSEAAAAELLDAADAAGLAATCVSLTGGNPFLLRELATELSERGDVPDAELAGLIKGDRAARIRARVAGSHPGAVAVARAVAVLRGDAELRRVAALAERPLDEVALISDALATARLLTATRPPRFVHPLVEAAVYEELRLGERAVLHAAAARLLIGDGVAPERVCAHLMLSEPAGDDRAVSVLRRAAASAARRGAPAAAVELLRRARLEPPPPEQRDAVALELATALVDVDPRAAQDELNALRGSALEPAVRAQAALALGRVVAMTGNLDAAIDALDGALAEVAGSDPDAAAEIECDLLSLARFTPTHRDRLRARVERFLRDHDTPDTPGGRRLRNELLRDAALGSTAAREVELALQALEGGRMLAEYGPQDQTYYHFVGGLAYGGHIDLALEAIDAALAAAAESGSVLGYAQAAAGRLGVLWEAGAVGEIVAAGPDVLALLDEVDWGLWVPFAAAYLAAAHAERAEFKEAEAVMAEQPVAAAAEGHPAALFVLWARGRLRARQGRMQEAVADLQASDRLQGTLSLRHPRGGTVVPELSIALWRLGREEEAARLAREHLDRCRHYGAAPALGEALRACGTVEAGEAGVRLLEEAVDVLVGSGSLLDEALAALALGSRLRHQRDLVAAREPLRHAIAVAQACGATGVEQRARAELRAAGGRPRRAAFTGAAALTVSERRVADLAAAGMSNRQIAQTLFVTHKTVEKHLAGAFRKLGIHSRAQLQEALRCSTGSG